MDKKTKLLVLMPIGIISLTLLPIVFNLLQNSIFIKNLDFELQNGIPFLTMAILAAIALYSISISALIVIDLIQKKKAMIN